MQGTQETGNNQRNKWKKGTKNKQNDYRDQCDDKPNE